MSSPKKTAWIVSKELGAPSQVWINRQIERFSKIEPILIYWKLENPNKLYEKYRKFQLPSPKTPETQSSKWLARLRNLFGLNFYSATKEEKDQLNVALKEQRPDVILCHFGHIALRLLPFAIKHNIPLVSHFHGLDLSSALNNRWYFWSLSHNISKFANLIVVGSHQEKKLAEMGVDRSKIHRIPCGVPIPAEAATPSKYERCNFLMVGRLVPKKAPLTTLEAFARCNANSPNTHLTVIGDGPLQDEMKAYVDKHDLANKVSLKGAQSPEYVKQAMLSSSAFVQHSITAEDGDKEGWPVAIAEAMSLGLPVVATKHAGITEQVDDQTNGFLVDEGDMTAMAAKMELIAKSPDLRDQFGKNAALKARRNFDIEKMIESLESVLQLRTS